MKSHFLPRIHSANAFAGPLTLLALFSLLVGLSPATASAEDVSRVGDGTAEPSSSESSGRDGEPFTPDAVTAADFDALKGQSPFTRSLNLSDLLILTGIATVDAEQVATLMNRETKETFVVSSQPNSQGWRMIELKADPDLEKVSAKVAVEGGEVVTVRYAEWQLKPGEAKPGAGPSEETPGGAMSAAAPAEGVRRGPPPQVRERLMQLPEEQRAKVIQRLNEIRQQNPEMSGEERGRAMKKVFERAAKGAQR